MKLTIPRIPPSPNGTSGYLRLHWASRRKDKATWKAEIELALRSSGPAMLELARTKVRVTVHQVRGRKLDRDNLWASVKNIVDAIVLCGLAVDDDDRWMDLHVTQETGKEHRTEITVEAS